jgi:hypothetical protein
MFFELVVTDVRQCRLIYRGDSHDKAMTCLGAEGISAGWRPNHFSD